MEAFFSLKIAQNLRSRIFLRAAEYSLPRFYLYQIELYDLNIPQLLAYKPGNCSNLGSSHWRGILGIHLIRPVVNHQEVISKLWAVWSWKELKLREPWEFAGNHGRSQHVLSYPIPSMGLAGICTNPWNSLILMVNVGKYTVRPMDPMGITK